MVRSQISLEFVTSSVLFVFLIVYVISSLMQSYNLIADDALAREAKSSSDQFVSQLVEHTGQLGWSEPFSASAIGLMREDAAGIPNFTTLSTSPPGGTTPVHAALAFLDEDSTPDLAGVGSGAIDDSEKIFILLGSPGQAMTAAGKQYSNVSSGINQNSVATGDINGDGYNDIVASALSSGFSVFLGDGQGQFSNFTSQSGLPVSSTYTAVTLEDVNGDGHPDAVAIDFSGTSLPTVFYNNGNGTFSSGIQPQSSATVEAFAFGDFNHDSHEDMVAATDTGITLFLNDGSGNFNESSSWVLPTSGTYEGVAVLDADADGLDDFAAIQNGASGGVYLFLNDGLTFTTINTIELDMSPAYTSIVSADFNGDGSDDIAFSSTKSVEIFLNDGTGGYTNYTAQASLPASGFSFLGAGDLNGDTVTDLFGVDSTFGSVIQLFNQPVFFQRPLREQPIKYEKLQAFAGLSYGQAKAKLGTNKNYHLKVSLLPSLVITSYYENEANVSVNRLLNTFSNNVPINISFSVAGSSPDLVPRVYVAVVSPNGRGDVFEASKKGDFYRLSFAPGEPGVYRVETVAMTDVYYGKSRTFIEVID